MRIEMTVTERDKRLLYVVGVLAFVALFGAFVLRPAAQAHAQARADYTAAAAQKQEMQAEIEAAAANAEARARAEQDVQAATADLYPLLYSDDLDTLVTGLALTHGLEPVSLSISSAGAPGLSGYAPGPLGGQSLSEAPERSGLRAVSLTSTVRGTPQDFTALLDDIAQHYPALHLRDFSVTESAWFTGSGGTTTVVQFRYELTVYMYDTEALAE